MFRRVTDIWKCIASDSHCGYFGPMCVSPSRTIYWANCHKDIISYDFNTNTMNNFYHHSTYIRTLFWYRVHLYFIDDQNNINRMTDSVTQIGILRGNERHISSCWNDEMWNAYIQSENTILRFDGEHFVDDVSGIQISKEKNIIVMLGDTVTTIETPEQEGNGFSHIVGQRCCADNIAFYIEEFRWNEVGVSLTKRLILEAMNQSINKRLINELNDSERIVNEEIKQTVLTAEIFPSRCLNPITGEIYAIDESMGQYSLLIYEYPLKSLLDLCVDVIKRNILLRLKIVTLPEELRDKFVEKS